MSDNDTYNRGKTAGKCEMYKGALEIMTEVSVGFETEGKDAAFHGSQATIKAFRDAFKRLYSC